MWLLQEFGKDAKRFEKNPLYVEVYPEVREASPLSCDIINGSNTYSYFMQSFKDGEIPILGLILVCIWKNNVKHEYLHIAHCNSDTRQKVLRIKTAVHVPNLVTTCTEIVCPLICIQGKICCI